MDVWGM
jgi:hypothetical protein